MVRRNQRRSFGMKTVTRTLGLVTVAIGTAACPQADRVDVVRIDTLSTGAVVVSNPATGVWQPGEAWELTVVREIRGQTSFWFDRIWALALDSVGRTYAADRSSTVRVFTPHGALRFSGDTLLTVHIDIPAPSIPAAERRSAYRAWRERLGFTAAATGQALAQPDLSAIPDTSPLFEDFWIDDLGNLWVVRRTSDGQLAQEFDIIDPSGRYLGKVSTPVPLDVSTNPIFAKGRLIGVARDSLDVEYIVSIAIGRSQ